MTNILWNYKLSRLIKLLLKMKDPLVVHYLSGFMCLWGFREDERTAPVVGIAVPTVWLAKLFCSLILGNPKFWLFLIFSDVTAIIQLLDNSVFLVGGPGGTRHLPRRDTDGIYHVDGVLHVANKPEVRDLVSKLTPLLKTLGPRVKKIFLSPLTRYWIRPCCSAPDHLTNYSAASYLPNLGVGV